MSNSKAMYGISRIDDDLYRTHAWRVSLRRQGKLHVKNFPDKKYGGKRKAQQAAKAYRDEVIRDYPPTTRKQFCATVRRNNTSGIPGVYTYGKRYALKDGSIRETRYWEAHWPVGENSSAKASFSYNTFGEKKAKELAIQARQAGIARLKGVFWASKRGELNDAVAAQAAADEAKKPGVKKAKTTTAKSKAAPNKKAAAKKKAVAKKQVAPKPVAAKKVPAKKVAAKKAAPKKAAVKKTTAKAAPAKKAAASKAAAKAPAKKPVAKKAPAKKAPAKKTPAKKAAVTKVAAKKAPTKKAPVKTAAKKSASTKSRKSRR